MSKLDELKKMQAENGSWGAPPKKRETVKIEPLGGVQEEVKFIMKKDVKPSEKATMPIVASKPNLIRYATYIRADQRKRVRMRAAAEDLDNQDIVQRALDEYFKNHPS
jgi:hypothetical protein